MYVFLIPVCLAVASDSLQGTGVLVNRYQRVENKSLALQKVTGKMTQVLMIDRELGYHG